MKMKMEADVQRLICKPRGAEDFWEPPECSAEAWNRFPEPVVGSSPAGILNFRFLVSGTVGRGGMGDPCRFKSSGLFVTTALGTEYISRIFRF